MINPPISANPKAVMAQLGHTSIQITFDRYGHLYDEEATNIAGRMNAVYLKAQQLVNHGHQSEPAVRSAYGASLRRPPCRYLGGH